MVSIGETLGEARRKKGLSVKDVEKAIKVRSKYLTALENDRFHEIPGEAYVVGFLKVYAGYLGLDQEALIAAYRRTEGIPHPKLSYERQAARREVKKARVGRGRRVLAFGFVLLAVVFLLLVRSLTAGPGETGQVEPEPVKVEETQEPEAVPVSSDQAGETGDVEPEEYSVLVVGSKGAWLRVVVDGQEVYEDIVSRGDELSWLVSDSITIRSGNAKEVEVFRDGRKLGVLDATESVTEHTFETDDG